jgi:hypothetical protein
VVISDPRHSKVSALRPKAQIPGPQSTRSATFGEQLAEWRGSVGSPAARPRWARRCWQQGRAHAAAQAFHRSMSTLMARSPQNAPPLDLGIPDRLTGHLAAESDPTHSTTKAVCSRPRSPDRSRERFIKLPTLSGRWIQEVSGVVGELINVVKRYYGTVETRARAGVRGHGAPPARAPIRHHEQHP